MFVLVNDITRHHNIFDNDLLDLWTAITACTFIFHFPLWSLNDRMWTHLVRCSQWIPLFRLWDHQHVMYSNKINKPTIYLKWRPGWHRVGTLLYFIMFMYRYTPTHYKPFSLEEISSVFIQLPVHIDLKQKVCWKPLIRKCKFKSTFEIYSR